MSSFFDSLAEDNLKFNNAIANAPWTFPSHVSLFTGKTPSEHGVNSWNDKLPKSQDTLASLLSEAGYQTVGFSHNMWLSRTFGMDNGFDDFYQLWQLIQSETNLYKAHHDAKDLTTLKKIKQLAGNIVSDNPIENSINAFYGKFLHNRTDQGARRTNRKIKSWLEKRDTNQPYFLFANYLEPHMPYEPPKELATKYLKEVDYEAANKIPQQPVKDVLNKSELPNRNYRALKSLYEAEIEYLDQRIKEIYQYLDSEGELENTVFIIVGDHGENIGDHNLLGHIYSLHDTVIRVPLIVRTPDGQANEIDAQVQLTDLFPLILEYAGIEYDYSDLFAELPPPMGKSRTFAYSELLAPNPTLEAVERRTEGSFDVDRFEMLSQRQRAIRTETKKMIRYGNGKTETMNISNDKGGSGISEMELRDQLDKWVESLNRNESNTAEVGDQVESKLQDLGYL